MAERWGSAVWPLAAWAVAMGALAGLQAALGGRALPVLLQSGAAVLCGGIALAIRLSRRLERRRLRDGLPVTALSLPTVLAGVCIAALVDGATVGSWLEIGATLGLALAAGLLWRGRRTRRGRRTAERGGGVVSAPSVLDVLGTWSVDPILSVTLALTGAAYLTAARRTGRWPARRGAAFLAGLAAVAFALESGLDVYGDELLSIHMVQHLVLVLVAPPLLLAGAPITLGLRALDRSLRQTVSAALRSRPGRLLGHPACGLAAIAAAMLGTHLTPLYGLAVRDPPVHVGEHILFLACGLLFWAVLIRPGPGPKYLDGLGQVVYLLLGMPLMSVVGVILETDSAPRYAEYLGPARRLGVSALADQRLAGALMWIVGTAIMGVVALSLAWRSMLAEERRAVARELYEDRSTPDGEPA